MIKNFEIAGGKKVCIELIDTINIDDGNSDFGEFNSVTNIISIANKVMVNDTYFEQSDEDKERTMWHEIFHVFQFYAGLEFDEMQAQVFSNFMYELIKSKK